MIVIFVIAAGVLVTVIAASEAISVAAAFNDCYTHPILGFDSKLCEKKIGEKNILNLIAFSDAKTLDRQRLSYRKDET